jgi:hypothetical protein
MKITQAAWDSLWENSAGVQSKMFDENGDRPEPSLAINYSAWVEYLKQPTPYGKFPALIQPRSWKWSWK